MATWQVRNVPLPEEYLVGLGVGLALHRLRRWPLSGTPPVGLGWLLMAGGAGIVAGAVRAAGAVELEHPGRLVTTGPYAYTRNPMYSGWALMSLGAGLVLNSRWLVAAVPLAAWWTHRGVLAEESRLAARFGGAFHAYRARVRRYG
jgi:protein-S-isoprenylcysteine O-methyltransferase Ste14